MLNGVGKKFAGDQPGVVSEMGVAELGEALLHIVPTGPDGVGSSGELEALSLWRVRHGGLRLARAERRAGCHVEQCRIATGGVASMTCAA